MILLKNDFTKKSLSEKTNEIYGKWTIVIRTINIKFVMNDWKKNDPNG